MATAKAIGQRPDLKAQLLPIAKRFPAYLRCGWALIREPAIPLKHKTLLYSVVLYSVTPAHMVVGVIPVLGQVDSVLMFLLGLRQALAHCPPAVRRRHLERLGISPGQLDEDLATVMAIARRAIRRGRREIRFAGRVAAGLGRRVAVRLLTPKPRPTRRRPP